MLKLKLLSLLILLLFACKKEKPAGDNEPEVMSDCGDITSNTGFPSVVPGWEVALFETGQKYYWSWRPYFLNEMVGFIFESNGHVFKTIDGGNSWKQVLHTNQAAPNSMFFVNEENGFLCAQNLTGCPNNCEGKMTIYRTKDGGEIWQKIVHDKEGSILDIYFSDTLNGIGTVLIPSQGYRQGVVRTSNGGHSWEVEPLPTLDGLTTFQMQMVDSVNGFFAGADGILYRTEDGGATFDSLQTPLEQIYNVSFFDAVHGLASDFNKTYRTADGGNTWELVCKRSSTLLHLSGPNEVLSIQVAHKCVDYDVLMHDAGFFVSNDGGATWKESELAQNFGIARHHFPSPNIGFGMYGSKLVKFKKQ